MDTTFSIAIDGPAGAGKSSVAKEVARRMNALYLDTGAMYRAAALCMLRDGVSMEDTESILTRINALPLSVQAVNGAQHTYLGDEDVSDAIRAPEISAAASAISKIPEVRSQLVNMQRQIALGQSVIMDGRDIGTKVLPNATIKIWLTASPEIRARRRALELEAKGSSEPFEKVLSDLIQRDQQDATRSASPMVPAEDAIEVDTSEMDFEAVVRRIEDLANAAIGGAT